MNLTETQHANNTYLSTRYGQYWTRMNYDNYVWFNNGKGLNYQVLKFPPQQLASGDAAGDTT